MEGWRGVDKEIGGEEGGRKGEGRRMKDDIKL
jgi:hypothetical protein